MKMNKKGFTLIELLVVVLIIGILAAIALPQYFKAVERARSAEALTVFSSLGGAQQRYRLVHPNNWAETFGELDIDFMDENNANATGATYSGPNYNYAISGGTATATRDGGRYDGHIIRKNFSTGVIDCHDASNDNPICAALGLPLY